VGDSYVNELGTVYTQYAKEGVGAELKKRFAIISDVIAKVNDGNWLTTNCEKLGLNPEGIEKLKNSNNYLDKGKLTGPKLIYVKALLKWYYKKAYNKSITVTDAIAFDQIALYNNTVIFYEKAKNVKSD